MLHRLHEAPATYGQPGTRWKLSTLLAASSELQLKTLAGLCQLLRRLKVSRKRARQHVRSPDPNYRDKLRSIRTQLLKVIPQPAAQIFLFEDEFTLYRQPSLAFAYEKMGKIQPLAHLGWTRNKLWRFAAGLNALSGQVTFVHGSQFSIPKLVKFYQALGQAYPQAELIWVVEDNWPMHFHPDVLAALQPQQFPFGVSKPGNWPEEPRAKAKRLNLPIRLLTLPTYASWTNPIEKLWRYLKQEVLHLHRYGDDWEGLKGAVIQFLQELAKPSPDLLRYVGLEDPIRLYQAALMHNREVINGGI